MYPQGSQCGPQQSTVGIYVSDPDHTTQQLTVTGRWTAGRTIGYFDLTYQGGSHFQGFFPAPANFGGGTVINVAVTVTDPAGASASGETKTSIDSCITIG